MRFYALAAWVATAFVPISVQASVIVHKYEVTDGFGSGRLSIGAITGGGFSVRFPTNSCDGTPDECHATLLSGHVTGSTGMFMLTPLSLSQQNLVFRHETRASARWSLPIGGVYYGNYFRVKFRTYGSFNALIERYSQAGGFEGWMFVIGEEVQVPEPAPDAQWATVALTLLGAYVVFRRVRSRRIRSAAEAS